MYLKQENLAAITHWTIEQIKNNEEIYDSKKNHQEFIKLYEIFVSKIKDSNVDFDFNNVEFSKDGTIKLFYEDQHMVFKLNNKTFEQIIRIVSNFILFTVKDDEIDLLVEET